MKKSNMHLGIRYEVLELEPGKWQWSFGSSNEATQSGSVVGKSEWAEMIAKRAIEVWKHLNEGAKPTWREEDEGAASRH